MPPADCETLVISQADPDDLRATAELICRTWPKPDKDAAFRLWQLQALAAGHTGPAEHAPRVYVVREGASMIAAAVIEPRTLGTADGPLTVAGLGKVCSDPAHRGQGLGARVVAAALAPVDRGVYPFCLFQTSHQVRPFYERIGACVVENKVIDSTAQDPQACPFADEVIMRYASGPGWPAGVIDLRGPGY